MNIDNVRHFLSKGEIEAALNALINYLIASDRKEDLEDAQRLQAIFAKAKKDHEFYGTTRSEDYELEINRTILRIQTILKNLEQPAHKQQKKKAGTGFRIWFWVIPIFLGIGVVVVFRQWLDSDETSQPPITASTPDSAAIKALKRYEPKLSIDYGSHKVLFSEIISADDLVDNQQWAPAYRKYWGIYNSMPDSLKRKLDRNDILKAERSYKLGRFYEASRLMKANFDNFKNTVHNQN